MKNVDVELGECRANALVTPCFTEMMSANDLMKGRGTDELRVRRVSLPGCVLWFIAWFPPGMARGFRVL